MNKPSNTFDIAIEQAFDFLSPEYAALFDSSAATAFQHPLWLDSLYARLASHAGATPLVVVVRRRATGALAMVLPLLRIRRGPIRTIEFADLRVSDYLAPVCSPRYFPSCSRTSGLRRNPAPRPPVRSAPHDQAARRTASDREPYSARHAASRWTPMPTRPFSSRRSSNGVPARWIAPIRRSSQRNIGSSRRRET